MSDKALAKALKASDTFPKNIKPIEKFMNKDLWSAGFEEGLLFMSDDGSISYRDGYVALFKQLGGCSPQLLISSFKAEDDITVFTNTVFDKDGQVNRDILARFIRKTHGNTDRQDLIEEAGDLWHALIGETIQEMDDAEDLLDRYAELADAACARSQLSRYRR